MDYTDCLQDLLDRLLAAGFVIDWVDDGLDNGDGFYANPKDAVDVMMSVDESSLGVSLDGVPFSLCIILGNDKSEIVADYFGPREKDTEKLDEVMIKFCAKWEGA